MAALTHKDPQGHSMLLCTTHVSKQTTLNSACCVEHSTRQQRSYVECMVVHLSAANTAAGSCMHDIWVFSVDPEETLVCTLTQAATAAAAPGGAWQCRC